MKPNSKQRSEIGGVKNWGKSGSGRLKNATLGDPIQTSIAFLTGASVASFNISLDYQPLRRKRACAISNSQGDENLMRILNIYSKSARWRWIADEASRAELAIIISYPTNASGIIVWLKRPK